MRIERKCRTSVKDIPLSLEELDQRIIGFFDEPGVIRDGFYPKVQTEECRNTKKKDPEIVDSSRQNSPAITSNKNG